VLSKKEWHDKSMIMKKEDLIDFFKTTKEHDS
jgi:hypothetical protein